MTTTIFWSIAGLMALAATFPVYRVMRGSGASAAPLFVAAAVISLSLATYHVLSDYDFDQITAAGSPHDPGATAMIEKLAARLEQEPGDVEGWRFLGRSYRAQGRYREAADAFERAYEIIGDDDPTLMLDLGEAMIFMDNAAINGRAGQLFENALAVAPGNSRALWYAGLAAASRGDRLLAADRWEKILALSPPSDVRGILENNIRELRAAAAAEAGVVTPDSGAMTPPEPDSAVAVVSADAPAPGTVPLEVRLSPELADDAPADAVLFIFARTPGVGGPPIAVIRRRADDLPLSLRLSDANAMLEGRKLSTEEELLLVARVSKSGTPVASEGDLFGEMIYRMDSGETAELIIDQVVTAN